MTYIALLRGINVGGYRKIKMDDLRALFMAIGYQDVSTYIQSGNVVFTAPGEERGEIGKKIQLKIDEKFGYEVPVLIRTASEGKQILDQFPFEEKEGWMGYVSFLPSKPGIEQQRELENRSTDIEYFKVGDREVYILVDKQTKEKPQFSNTFIEQQMEAPATTRNLRTVRRILELI